MGPTLPFRLKIPGKDEIDGFQVTSTSFKVHGFLSLDGDHLIVEWGGTVHIQEVSMAIRDDTEPIRDERLEIHVGDLLRAELTGGWFRPRLTIQARAVGVLSSIPSEEFGTVNFWYERSERFTAVALARALGDAIAHASLPSLDQGDDVYDDGRINTPPG